MHGRTGQLGGPRPSVAARDKWLADQDRRAADAATLEDEFGPEIAAMVRRNPDRRPEGTEETSRYGWLDAVRR